jgi:ribosomal protein S18 acetylase RimI-like enzyme
VCAGRRTVRRLDGRYWPFDALCRLAAGAKNDEPSAWPFSPCVLEHARQGVRMSQYPTRLRLSDGATVTVRRMRVDDVDRILGFSRALPEDDLLFLRMDITERQVVERWAMQLGLDRAVSFIAEVADVMVGYGSLFYNETTWQRHMGEMRLLVAPAYRSRRLGHALAAAVYESARARGLRKIVAHMTSDQKAAISTFERLGFQAEALLQDFVIDRRGRTHDLVVMAHDVEGLSNTID